MKRHVGRPSKYNPDYIRQLQSFFGDEPYNIKDMTITKSDGTQIDKTEKEANRLPTLFDFAKKIGVNIDTLYEWGKKHPGFSEALKDAMYAQENFVIQNGLLGLYNAPFALKFLCNKHKWTEKQEIEHSGEVGHKLFLESIVSKIED